MKKSLFFQVLYLPWGGLYSVVASNSLSKLLKICYLLQCLKQKIWRWTFHTSLNIIQQANSWI